MTHTNSGDALDYGAFIAAKAHSRASSGVELKWVPDLIFPFQREITERALARGRSAIFADCGLGKTIMMLTWAENVCRATGGNVLILTPLAVGHQMMAECVKFGVEASRSQEGKVSRITITNYERLNRFNPDDFVGVVCDESSILKSFDGIRRSEITEFMRRVRYRLLATATASPNDYTELGTSSEALGHMGHMDMLSFFFTNDNNNLTDRRMYGEAPKWRFKGHAATPFWRWVASWATALRKPSDIGFDNDGFDLPSLIESEMLVDVEEPPTDALFAYASSNIHEQRAEKNRTIKHRCEAAADIANSCKDPVILWCQLNEEGNLLESLITGSVQISGSDSDDRKEAKFDRFIDGDARVLITKPKIGAWGLNFQHCSKIVYFPSHSYEQYYQAVRRCWRFGQTRDVEVSLVMTEGERLIMRNLHQKALKSDAMFTALVEEMNNGTRVEARRSSALVEVPSWL